MTKFRLMLGALVLALTGLAAPAGATEARPAHTDSFQTAWACGATRPSEEHTLLHAHTTTRVAAYVAASCISRAEDRLCTWSAILWWNGQVSRASSYSCTIVG